MKLNFWTFHQHDYHLIRWKLVHYPEYEPSRIVARLKCKSCSKEVNWFPKERRNTKFEDNNRDLQGYWLGNEKEVE